jgi:hypothetical protein
LTPNTKINFSKGLKTEIQDDARRKMEEGAIDSGDEWVRFMHVSWVYTIGVMETYMYQ